MTATNLRVVPAAPAPARWLGRVLAIAVIAFFAIFFVVPLAWLLLAPTKNGDQLGSLHGESPFSFGSFDQLAQNWNQSGHVPGRHHLDVARQLGVLLRRRAGDHDPHDDSRGLRARDDQVQVATRPAHHDAHGHAHPEHGARAADLPRTLGGSRLIGSPLGVILPFSFFPFGVYLAYIYFSTTMSHDLLDAARIDGAGEFKVFTRIAMPLATPVIALVGFFNFVGNWNNYFLPFIMEPGADQLPVQVGLAVLLSSTPAFNPTNAAALTITLPELALATLISVAPVLIVFLFSQRFLVTGLTAGATKG